MNDTKKVTSFTLSKHPPRGGRYITFNPANPDTRDPSPYDRVQLFCFRSPPFGFDEDPMFDDTTITWSLSAVHIVDVFLDQRDDLPIFTVVEERGKYCRLTQVGGVRQVRDIQDLWLSVEMVRRALDIGTLELLS